MAASIERLRALNARLAAKLPKQAQQIEIEPVVTPATDAAPAKSVEQAVAGPPPADPGGQCQTDFINDAAWQSLSQQIGNELYAHYEYLAGEAWFSAQGLEGFAAWARKQAGGELEHVRKIFDFMVEADAIPQLPAIKAPPASYPDVRAALVGVFDRERAVSANWRAIAKMAMASGDAATVSLAQWFVREQMEEEGLVKTVLQRYTAAGDGPGLVTLDGQLMEEYGEK